MLSVYNFRQMISMAAECPLRDLQVMRRLKVDDQSSARTFIHIFHIYWVTRCWCGSFSSHVGLQAYRQMRLGNDQRDLQVMQTEGHTRTHICLYKSGIRLKVGPDLLNFRPVLESTLPLRRPKNLLRFK